jgi:membrane fusion protein, multidrug efflux system
MSATSTETAGDAQESGRMRRSGLRAVLLWVVPVLVLVIAGALYVIAHRYASTDNAYVKADKTIVRAQVDGNVLAVMARENEWVPAGTPLIRLDDSILRFAVTEAQARLGAVSTEINALKASYAEKSTELEVARHDASFTERDLKRQRELAARHLISQSTLDGADRAAEVARGRVAVLERELEQIRATLGGDAVAPVAENPKVQAAAAALAHAELDLEHAVIIAPRKGIVSRLPQPGDRLEVGTAAAAIVADEGAWIEANFKETDVAALTPGQQVDIEIDSYPGRNWRGRIESIAQATGAEFALLPPQNASGNWVKVVQRIPVRISIDADSDDPPLRAGMSAYVRIDKRQATPAAGPREARAGR